MRLELVFAINIATAALNLSAIGCSDMCFEMLFLQGLQTISTPVWSDTGGEVAFTTYLGGADIICVLITRGGMSQGRVLAEFIGA